MDEVFRAIADPTRRAILDELVDRDGQSLFELCSRLTMKHGIGSSRQAISQHLEVLEGGLGFNPPRRAVQISLAQQHAVASDLAEVVEGAERERLMRINVTSVLVDDQEKAQRFYTNVLGFEKKHDIPLGAHRWLTVVSPSEPNGTELVLEPDAHPAAKPFKTALVEDGIPYTSFAVEDAAAEYQRLSELGVRFVQPPTDLGAVITAVLDDTCGNLIQIAQLKGAQ